MEHTKGPWKFVPAGSAIEGEPGHENRFDYPAHVKVSDRDEEGLRRTRFIAECNGAGLPNDANACLIAHAPELIEALKQVRAALRVAVEVGTADLYDTREECREAAEEHSLIKATGILIAKAEGRAAPVSGGRQ